MTQHKVGFAVTISLLMVLSVVASGLAVAETEASSNLPEDDVHVITDGSTPEISVWNGAAFTLRSDDSDAATQITPPNIYGGTFTGDKSDYDKSNEQPLTQAEGSENNPVGVHNPSEITVEFKDDRANANLEGEDVQLVSAKLDPAASQKVPDTYSQAIDLLSNIETANSNAEFTKLKDATPIGSDGTVSSTHYYDTGAHLVFAVVNNDGNEIETPDGDISLNGDVTIVGMDQIVVQDAGGEVEAPTRADRGDILEFDITTPDTFDGKEVSHTVAVYKKSTLEDARFNVLVDESEIDSDFDPSTDVLVEHSIDEVHGVVQKYDQSTDQGTMTTGPRSVQSIIDFLASEAGVDNPMMVPSEEAETIDASVMSVKNVQEDVILQVETLDDFSTGEYQWVAVSSTGDNQGRISTATGTLELERSSSGGGYNPPNGGGSDPGDDDGSKDKDPKVTSSVTVDIVDVDPDSPGVTVRLNNSSVEEITFSDEDTTGEVTVNDTDALPDETGSPTGQMVRSLEITVPEEARDKPASFRVQVDKSTVDDLDVDESELVVNRYNESAGEWQELSTDVAECECGDIILEVETPGFSWFAVTAPEDQSPTDTPADPTPTQTPDGDDDGTSATETEDDDGDDDELLPGFTAGVALIAILGAALLAARRQQ